MMVTDIGCWWQNHLVGDVFPYVVDLMMVTDLRCWWQNHYVGDSFRYANDFLNVFNRSPTSQTCHQHIWSPTSVTNIDVIDDYRIQKLFLRTVFEISKRSSTGSEPDMSIFDRISDSLSL